MYRNGEHLSLAELRFEKQEKFPNEFHKPLPPRIL